MLLKLGVGILVFFVVSELALLIGILISKYDIVLYYSRRGQKKSTNVGGWHGGTFYAQPFFPIDRDPKNVEIDTRIKLYNRMVYFLWGNVLTLFLALLLLKLSDY